jgi:WD40 repeat protein
VLPHRDTPGELAFSPDGRWLASEDGSGNNQVRVWDTATGEEHRLFTGRWGSLTTLTFTPDGQGLVLAGKRALGLDHVSSSWQRPWHEIMDRDAKALQGIAFSPDGRWLATAYERELRLRRADTNEVVWTVPAVEASLLAFSPDGRRLVSAWTGEGTLSVHDVATGELVVRPPEHPNTAGALAVSPDGATVATGCADGSIHLWEARKGRPTRVLRGHEGAVTTLAFAPDGRTLTSGGGPAGQRGRNAEVRLWDLETGRLLHALAGHQRGIETLAVSADGRTVVSGSEEAVRLWDVAAGKQRPNSWLSGRPFWTLQLSPDGKWLAATNYTLRVRWRQREPELVTLWETATGKPLSKLADIREELCGLAFSPDGRSLAGSGYSGTVHLWDLLSGQVRQRWERPGLAYAVLACSRDSRLLAAGDSRTGLIQVRELATGQEVLRLTGHRGPVTALAFGPGSRLLFSASSDRTVLVWDLYAAALRPASALPSPWDDLRQQEGPAGFQAVARLCASPAEGLALLRGQLRPVPPRDVARIRRLLAELDEEDFDRRDSAMRELEALGPVAGPELEEVLRSRPAAEVRRRVQELILGVYREELTPDQLRQRRAVQALEAIGTPEAAVLLEQLAGGEPLALFTRDVRAALERTGKRGAPREK